VNDCTRKAHSDDYYRGYEAGQQSKQAEVDELRFQRDVLSNKVDELQKRIDEVIYDLQHIESAMWEEQVEHVLMILKGDQS
jgi:peptidoglycan hydrolase CwlO-like protein